MTFWAVKSRSLRSLCGSDPPLKFNQKYLHLCSEDEQRSYGVGIAWG